MYWAAEGQFDRSNRRNRESRLKKVVSTDYTAVGPDKDEPDEYLSFSPCQKRTSRLRSNSSVKGQIRLSPTTRDRSDLRQKPDLTCENA